MKLQKLIFIVIILTPFCQAAFSQIGSKPVVMIVHGTWSGGWRFQEVSSLLTENECIVYTPTLTGLGERFHLSSPEIGLETHINDIVSTIIFEELSNVILVGHSYGGMVIAGVADSIPERIRKMVYVDAVYPEDGESVYSALGPANLTWAKVENEYLIPTWLDKAESFPKLVPHPLKSWTDEISLHNPDREKIPTVFILTVDKGANPEDDLFHSQANKARLEGFSVLHLEADHNPQDTALSDFIRILEDLIR